jgi:hypothetical protein
METPPPDLTDDDKAIIAELLHETIERSRRLLSPRVRSYRAIVAKLDPPPSRPEPLPPPEPPGERSMALRRGRSRGLALLAAALVIATTNYAAGRDINLKDLVTAEGECRIELVKGAGYGRCDDGVIYMLFKNGRHLIMFHNKDDVIALAGAGDRTTAPGRLLHQH